MDSNKDRGIVAAYASVETPLGALAFIVDEEGYVLSTGWNCDAEALLGRIHSTLRPEALLMTKDQHAKTSREDAPITDEQTTETMKLSALPEQREKCLYAGISRVSAAIIRYSAGDFRALDELPVRMKGTALQEKVWQELRNIPPGTTMTYTQLAQASNRPRAVRAVASACGKNPVGLIIPCHRVVRADLSLGGFAWGLELKKALLDLEEGTYRQDT